MLEWFETLRTERHLLRIESIEILKLAGFLQMFTNDDQDTCLRDFELFDFIMNEHGILSRDYDQNIYDFDELLRVLENDPVSKSKIGENCPSHNVPYK